MRITIISFMFFVSSAFHAVMAGPESAAVSVIEVRPYISGGIFVTVSDSLLCGTNVFLIGADAIAQKEMYSAVLTALVSGKKVRLEAHSTGCAGWGTQLQSIYLQAN